MASPLGNTFEQYRERAIFINKLGKNNLRCECGTPLSFYVAVDSNRLVCWCGKCGSLEDVEREHTCSSGTGSIAYPFHFHI